MDAVMQQLIDALAKKGFKVYGPAPLTSYLYFTDGKRIGYAQNGRLDGISYSTVHQPCTQVGTGFRADSAEEALRFAPAWALERDRAVVKKYKDFEHFQRAHWQPLVAYTEGGV